jgi:hypothetical protein
MITEDLIAAASKLADELTGDIELAKNREDHIRVTARANAARELVNLLTASGVQV